MTLIIDPKSERGKIQLEALGWAQDQMNKVLEQYFNNEYKLLKGLKLEFRMRLDLQLNDTIKVDVSSLEPQTEERFAEAVEQARKHIPKPQEPVIHPNAKAEISADIIDQKVEDK